MTQTKSCYKCTQHHGMLEKFCRLSCGGVFALSDVEMQCCVCLDRFGAGEDEDTQWPKYPKLGKFHCSAAAQRTRQIQPELVALEVGGPMLGC